VLLAIMLLRQSSEVSFLRTPNLDPRSELGIVRSRSLEWTEPAIATKRSTETREVTIKSDVSEGIVQAR